MSELEPERRRELPPGRLVGWALLVGGLIVLNYASRLADAEPPEDFVYRWDSAIGGTVQFGIMLAIVLALARGPWRNEVLGLRRPDGWSGALGATAAVLVGVYIVAAVASTFVDAGEEQGLVPESWEPDRIAPFVANFVVIALVAPLTEELTFRGLGYGLLLPRYGARWAIGVTAVTWALGHGLIEALVIFVPFGLGLAWLRMRTDSVYPCLILHAVFNAAALLIAVAVAA